VPAGESRLSFAKLGACMHGDILFDMRNMLAPDRMRLSGYRYLAIGRPRATAATRSTVEFMPTPTGGAIGSRPTSGSQWAPLVLPDRQGGTGGAE
jgi:hypothetical protein